MESAKGLWNQDRQDHGLGKAGRKGATDLFQHQGALGRLLFKE